MVVLVVVVVVVVDGTAAEVPTAATTTASSPTTVPSRSIGVTKTFDDTNEAHIREHRIAHGLCIKKKCCALEYA